MEGELSNVKKYLLIKRPTQTKFNCKDFIIRSADFVGINKILLEGSVIVKSILTKARQKRKFLVPIVIKTPLL